MKALSVEVPGYVGMELKIRAAHLQTSVRYIIMNALAMDGFTIRDADLVRGWASLMWPRPSLISSNFGLRHLVTPVALS
jgi:hypothetical protein